MAERDGAAARDAGGLPNGFSPGASGEGPRAELIHPPAVTAPNPMGSAKPAPAASDELLSTPLKRVDEDRWLATRFAPAATRARLETLYSFNYEVSRTAEAVSEPNLGLIRLAWWREALNGGPGAANPLALAMVNLLSEANLDAAVLDALIEARAKDFDEIPFEGWGDLEAYVDATAGAVAHLALQICLTDEPWPKQATACARAVGRAWGFTGLMRAAPVWHARRRTFLPRRLIEHLKITPAQVFADNGSHVLQQASLAMLDRARFAYGQAQDLARLMPTAAFPAIGYVALEPGYRNAQQNGQQQKARALLGRQLRLVAASALGRF